LAHILVGEPVPTSLGYALSPNGRRGRETSGAAAKPERADMSLRMPAAHGWGVQVADEEVGLSAILARL
jgi:hypothetical protein